MVAGKEISHVFLRQLSTSVFFKHVSAAAPGRFYSRCRCHCACAEIVSLPLSPSRTRFSCRGLFLERAFERCVYSCDLRRTVKLSFELPWVARPCGFTPSQHGDRGKGLDRTRCKAGTFLLRGKGHCSLAGWQARPIWSCDFFFGAPHWKNRTLKNRWGKER